MIPSDEFIDWVFAATRWAFDEVLYPESVLAREAFVLPTWDDFPVDESLEGEALAEDYFAFVREHIGMTDDDLEVELVPREPASPAKILEGMAHHMTGPVEGGGVLLREGDPLPIEYDPELVSDPLLLVAVLSRGLTHWMCAPCPEPPGGEESFHFAVDLVWVLLGFGVFASSCAHRSTAHERGGMIGWGVSRFGALGPLELAYCTGLFAELLELDDRDAGEHLGANARAWLADARKDLRRRHADRVAALRAGRPATGPYRH
ncbi:MAG: hypothetical protein M5U28_48780 [Sandaracinaceae bacterium]|nr:hypothetical protein [Sandaracinaceae bacterium]